MLTWIVSGWIHLALGFGAGWLLVKRPELMTSIITWVKSKIGLAG